MDFYTETKNHLAQVNDRTWILNSPHVLYLTPDQAAGYSNAKSDENYNSFHDDTVKVIEKHKAPICTLFGQHANPWMLFDLGPEYPDKTLPILKQMKETGVQTVYVPVDINEKYMRMAQAAGAPFAQRAQGIRAKFCDFARARAQRPDLYTPSMTFVGLTFMNFPPDEILDLMKKIGGRDAWFGIASELITDDNKVEDIRQHYWNRPMRDFAYGPLQNLKVLPEHLEYNVQFNQGRVEVGFIFRYTYTDLGIGGGDRIICAISHRYTKQELTDLMIKNSSEAAVFLSSNRKTAVAFGRIPNM